MSRIPKGGTSDAHSIGTAHTKSDHAGGSRRARDEYAPLRIGRARKLRKGRFLRGVSSERKRWIPEHSRPNGIRLGQRSRAGSTPWQNFVQARARPEKEFREESSMVYPEMYGNAEMYGNVNQFVFAMTSVPQSTPNAVSTSPQSLQSEKDVWVDRRSVFKSDRFRISPRSARYPLE